MPVQLVSGIGTLAYPQYVGLSHMARPVLGEQESAALYELDTRRIYVWFAGEWRLHYDPPTDASIDVLLEIRDALKEILLIQQVKYGALEGE